MNYKFKTKPFAHQLKALEKRVDPTIQKQVFIDVILNGTTTV